jgi:CRISPR type III-B/RAMP module RAMP protein Cmr1
MMTTKLTLELVTPCFLSGPDSEWSAEWRAPSIRGQLRWWFRAVVGATHDLAGVRRAEERVFGSTERRSLLNVHTYPIVGSKSAGEECRYGRRLDAQTIAHRWGDTSPATIARLKIERLNQGALQEIRSNPIHYLAYGAATYNRDTHRVEFTHARFEVGVTASLTLSFTRQPLRDDFDLFRRALWCWLNLGGIGAKARRGFGSLRCIDVSNAALGDLASLNPDSVEAFTNLAGSLRVTTPPGAPAPLPDWPHLSPRTRIFIDNVDSNSWSDALERAGSWLIAFRRRYGFPGDTRTLAGTPLANRDYAWTKGAASRAGIPDRAGFGLPLPFGQTETITWGEGNMDNRSASSLLLHVSHFASGYRTVLTHIPSRLAPPGQYVTYRGPDAGNPQGPTEMQETIVGAFLDDLHGAPKKLVCQIL